jgi:membrane protein YdbS with pleckstrin-like domain
VSSTLRDPAHRVSPRTPLVWAAGALVPAVVVAGALVVATAVWHWWDMPLAGWVGYAVVALAYVVTMPVIRYRVHRWETTDTAVYTQSGWLSRERRIAPMSRVQTVDVEQGPVARLLGLASVTVTTASAAGPLRIDGLDRATADRLVTDLTRQTEAQPGDAT